MSQADNDRSDRIEATLALAECLARRDDSESRAATEHAYRTVVDLRLLGSISEEEEALTLTALNELAAFLIRDRRAPEAAALYGLEYQPKDPEEMTGFHYSAALASKAAGDLAGARMRLLEVIQQDALFGSAAELLADSIVSTPLEKTVDVLVPAVRALTSAGLVRDTERILNAIVMLGGHCDDRTARAVAEALIVYLTQHAFEGEEVRRRWTESYSSRSCESRRRWAAAIEGLYEDSETIIIRASNELIAADIANKTTLAKLLRNTAQVDLAQRRYRSAYHGGLAAASLDPVDSSVLADAAYALAMAPGTANPKHLLERVRGSSLTPQQQAVAQSHLAHAFAARGSTSDAADTYGIAAAAFDEPSIFRAAIWRKYADLQAGSNDSNAAAAYERVISDCQTLKDSSCAKAAAGAAAKHGIELSLELTPIDVERNLLLSSAEMLRRMFGGVEAASQAPSKALRWSATVSSSQAASPSLAASAIDSTDWSLFFDGPLVEERTWLRAAYENRDARRQLGDTTGSVRERQFASRFTLEQEVPDGVWSGTVLFEENDSSDETWGAASGRAAESVWTRTARARYAAVGVKTEITERGVVEMAVSRTEDSTDMLPRDGGARVAILDAEGIRRGTWGSEEVESRTNALRAATTLFITSRWLVHAGTNMANMRWTRARSASPVNAETISRILTGDGFDLVRLYRAADVSAYSRSNSLWTAMGYHGPRFAVDVGIRRDFMRAAAAARATSANPLTPHLLPALASKPGGIILWSATSPHLKLVATIPAWGGKLPNLEVSLARDVEGEWLSRVAEFANGATLGVVDAAFEDVNGNGNVDADELRQLRPLASYGIALGTSNSSDLHLVNVRAPVRDRLDMTLRILGGQIEIWAGFERVSRLPETRPLIHDQTGGVRPAVRSDFVSDLPMTFSLDPRLKYTGGYLLTNSDRRREIRFARVDWSRLKDLWAGTFRAGVREDVWRMGSRFEEEHDPTPLAQTWDRWKFFRGTIDGAPAADDLTGESETTLAIPNHRWEVSFAISRRFFTTLIGPIRTGIQVAAREGHAVSEFFRVQGSDGIERHVASSRTARMPPFASMDLFLEWPFRLLGRHVALRIDCLQCSARSSAVRRFNQQNAIRANVTEEAQEARVIGIALRWFRGHHESEMVARR